MARSRRATFDTVRKLASALTGAEEYLCYGTPAFRVRRKIFLRLKEDGQTLVVRVDDDTREALMQADPQTYFITDHYVGYPMMLVRLLRVHPAALKTLVEQAWRLAGGRKAPP